MNYYPHHIADFNNATRHLTLVERALYRELIDRYYETENAIPADDFDGLARKVLARSDEEKAALRSVLAEFFTLVDGVYSHKRCDAEILIYKEKIDNAHKAGKASALARAKRKVNKRSTGVEQALNDGATGPQPTNPTTPIRKEAADAADTTIWDLGIKFLKTKGVPEKQARTILGSHYKADKEKLASVVAQMLTIKPIEPIAYLQKAMQPEVRRVAI